VKLEREFILQIHLGGCSVPSGASVPEKGILLVFASGRKLLQQCQSNKNSSRELNAIRQNPKLACRQPHLLFREGQILCAGLFCVSKTLLIKFEIILFFY
jgi:hypothetical protein